MYTDFFELLDRFSPLQFYAASIALLIIVYAVARLVQFALDLNETKHSVSRVDEPPPGEHLSGLQVALIAVSAAAALIFLDDSAETVSLAHAATAAHRADVKRLQTLNDIVNNRCPVPDAIEREIVLIDWRTSADLHTNAGAHISCARYLQSGWFTAATTPKGPQ